MALRNKTKVDLNKLGDEILETIKDYNAAVIVDVETVTRQLAHDTADVVESAWRSSGAPHAASSDYGREFDVTRRNLKTGRVSYVVHASGEDYRLSHLLEHGHAIVRGGRTVGEARAFPHFERGQKYAEREFVTRVIYKLRH